MKIETLIKKAKINWVNSDITPEHFHDTEIRGEVKTFHFNEYLTSEEVINRMEKDGYEPANILELIQWHIENPENQDWVVALGSVWQDSGGGRGVPCLLRDAGKRDLDLRWFDYGWGSDYRFAAVKQVSLDSKTLSISDPLTLRISALEAWKEKVEKIINIPNTQ